MGIRIFVAMMMVVAGCSAERSDDVGVGDGAGGVGPGAHSGRAGGDDGDEGPQGPHGIGDGGVMPADDSDDEVAPVPAAEPEEEPAPEAEPEEDPEAGADPEPEPDEVPVEEEDPEAEPEPDPEPGPSPLACDPEAIGEWAGQFTGEIDSDWGSTSTEGDINFEIVCSDRKLEVHGTMQGHGNLVFEYRSELDGHYDPSTNTLRADIVDGNVNLFLVQVGFGGELIATLDNGEFNPGTWEGASTDPPGLSATGAGDWTAQLR